MKLLILISVFSLLVSSDTWLHDIEQAKTEAKQSNKHILLLFSGSDWCIPCIKMKEQVFADSIFQSFADKQLILVNADFPRLKKNALSKKQIQHNERLAEQYNPNGYFPVSVLLDSSGQVLKTWEGLPKVSVADFIADMSNNFHAK